MATSRSSHLTLLARPDWSVFGRGAAAATLARRKCVLRRAFLRRLDQLSAIAPDAPLSCLAIDIAISPAAADESAAMTIVIEQVLSLTRPTDVIGQVQDGMVAILLQGTGTAAASAVAARLQFHLNEIEGLRGRLHAAVSAATGVGANGRTLLAAAMETFLDCS